MAEQPLVSVVIPVYNRKNTIQKSVESVLNQTYRNIELIIVDDGSTDGTIDILKKLGGTRTTVFEQNHKGANAARNLGIKHAKGEFIAFQDSDDEWLPEKLEKQITYMCRGKYDACYCAFYLYGKDNDEIIPSDYENKEKLEKNLIEILKNYNVVSTQTLVIHQNIVQEVGGFDEEMPRLQDYEYAVRLIRKKQIGYVAEPLVKVYYSENSISSDDTKLEEAYFKIIKKHGNFLNVEFLIKRYLQIDFKNLSKLEQKIQKTDEYLKEQQEHENINLYKIVMELMHPKYVLTLNSFKDEYKKRVKRLISDEFAIYGAGKVGKEIFFELSEKNLRPRCFLVTEKGSLDELYGVPIIELKQWNEKRMEIIVGVSMELQYELIENLLAAGCTNYFRYPDV